MKEQIEVERRWLLGYQPPLMSVRTLDILNTYVVDDPIRYRRVSVPEDYEFVNFYATQKTFLEGGKFPLEKEWEITEKEYIDAIYLKKSSRIRKYRNIYNIDGLEYECDRIFLRSGELLILEIELSSEDYPLKLNTAFEEAVILEITGMKEFSNYSLAQKFGFP